MGCHHSKSANSQDPNAVDPSRKRMSTSQADKKKDPKNAGADDSGAISRIEGNILDIFPDYATSQKRMFALGTLSETHQKGFADKSVRKSSNSDDKALDFKDVKIGYACKKGLKPESPNQDDFCIFVLDSLTMLGVFDGHGPYGHEIANFTHEMLPEAVVKSERFKDDPKQALSDAFPRTHDMCVGAADKSNFDCSLSGTTATMALVKKGTLYVANVGDSRAVLAKGSFKAEDLTEDHKPDCEAESSRIVASGKGQIRHLQGDIPKRVFIKDKMYPGLAMTRSIGDTVGIEAGVISTPYVNSRRIEQDWRFLLLCSDGVWEFISSQEAVDIVSRYPPAECQKGAEALASESWNRWIKEEGNVVDDITVILYWFSEK